MSAKSCRQSLGMGQSFQFNQRLETRQTLRIDPRMIAANHVLQLASAELDSAIESELSENPALERVESADPVTDHEVYRVIAPSELKPWKDSWESQRSLPDEGDDNWIDFAASNTSIVDQLLASMATRVEPHLVPVAEYVVGSLDEHGYLRTPSEEIALDKNCTIEEAETVIRALHQCEPAGIGARNLLECLMLQLKGDSSVDRIARKMLKSFLDDVVSHRLEHISRRLRIDMEAVAAAYERIRELNPYPVEHFHGQGLGAGANSITPDLIIDHSEHGWRIEATGYDSSAVKVNSFYARKLSELKKLGKSSEARHIADFVTRANEFIQSLHSRKQTLERVGRRLVEIQAGFLSTGRRDFLKPLSKCQLAKDLGMHESTISRATSGKFIQVPGGEIVSFELFFKPALKIQKIIEEIVAAEVDGHRLSDEKISQKLAERGIKVARRTVNKYRDQGKMLSSRKRRAA